MPEYNILEAAGLPQIKRREGKNRVITEDIKKKIGKLDFDYYDKERKYGYGGYYYDGRWRRVAKIIKERYKLNENSKVLIIRCHKGFLVYDLMELIPGITVYGMGSSEYPLNHCMEGYGRWALMNGMSKDDWKVIEERARLEVTPFLIKGDSTDIPFKDDFFDAVISIEDACAYDPEECKTAVKEIIRVCKYSKNCYIQNDAWRNEYEKEKLLAWTFLCKTFLSTEDWEKLFRKVGYDGDWGYTIIT